MILGGALDLYIPVPIPVILVTIKFRFGLYGEVWYAKNLTAFVCINKDMLRLNAIKLRRIYPYFWAEIARYD